MPTQLTERRTEKLDVRISPSAKAKLQAAATSVHRQLSDFVLDSALSRAEETLADRRVFHLDAARWTAFQAALDAPPRSMPQMKALLTNPGFFDVDSSK